MYESVDVLAIGSHPDDVELGCGGTLLQLKSRGYRVGVLDLTRGELGSRGTAQIRQQEAQRAAQILGLEFRGNLWLKDGNILVDEVSRLKLIQVIRQCCPELVITHSRVGHPDHGHTARLVEEAVHHSGLVRIETGQERFRPERIAYWLVFNQKERPQVVVDVSNFYEQKEMALRAFVSQLYNRDSQDPENYLSHPEFLGRVRNFHGYLGTLAGCRFGEGFLLSRIPKIDDLARC